MFTGSETVHRGIGWKATVDQYSNKGAIILVEDDNGEVFRILYDVGTKRLKLLLFATGEKVEVEL